MRRLVTSGTPPHPGRTNAAGVPVPRARAWASAVLAITLGALVSTPAIAVTPRNGSAAAHSPEAVGPPNVVVIMVDDLPPLDHRLYAALPVIRETFLRHGLEFTDFHSETPLCCPARVGFLTGQHTFHHGVDRNSATLFRPEMTLATQLRRAGYQTMLAGKYLNGYSRLAPAMPLGWDRFSAKEGDDYYDYSLWNDGNPTPERHGHAAEDYLTDVTRQKAAAQLRAADPSRPIFAWIAANAPHAPWLPAPRHENDPRCDSIAQWKPASYGEANVSDKPAWVQAQRRFRSGELRTRTGFDLVPICRSLLSVDELVKKIRSVLRELGRLDNTILVFAGDNGMNYGAHRLGNKLGPYETAIPFFVSWPAGLGTKPRKVTDTVMNIDFAPTICELAGCTLGPYPNGQQAPDGKSFLTLLLGSESSMQRDSVIEDLPAGQQGVPAWYAARTTGASSLRDAGCEGANEHACRWHYIRYDDGFEELYDTSGGPCIAWKSSAPGDPCELVNVAGDPSYLPILNAMRYRLNTLRSSTTGGD